MQQWAPPAHNPFLSNKCHWNDETKEWEVRGTPATNTLFGAFFLALERLQQLLELPPGEGTEVGEGVAMVDPAAAECALRHWTLGDSSTLHTISKKGG
jgi:hypothetical protein